MVQSEYLNEPVPPSRIEVALAPVVITEPPDMKITPVELLNTAIPFAEVLLIVLPLLISSVVPDPRYIVPALEPEGLLFTDVTVPPSTVTLP